MTFRARTFRGHDYTNGCDVELTRHKWRQKISQSEYTRRIGTDLLAFARDNNGRLLLTFEVYDGGSLGNIKSRGGVRP
jgi:hypothetical protein